MQLLFIISVALATLPSAYSAYIPDPSTLGIAYNNKAGGMAGYLRVNPSDPSNWGDCNDFQTEVSVIRARKNIRCVFFQ
jgi:hypothetical protein